MKRKELILGIMLVAIVPPAAVYLCYLFDKMMQWIVRNIL